MIVQPGQQYADDVRVFGGQASTNLHPQFLVDQVSGVYRIVWVDVLRDYDERTFPFGEPLAIEQRVSNGFELRATLQ